MLGQRYTTPMVTVVCPVTNLHHMTSLQSASSFNCTAGIVSLMYNNTPPPLLPTGRRRDEQQGQGRNNGNSGEVQESTEEDDESKGGTDNLIRNFTSVW